MEENKYPELNWREFRLIRQGVGLQVRHLITFAEKKSIFYKKSSIHTYESKFPDRRVKDVYVSLLKNAIDSDVFSHHYNYLKENGETKYQVKFLERIACKIGEIIE